MSGQVIIDGETLTIEFFRADDQAETALLLAQLDTLLEQMDTQTPTDDG